MKNVPHPLAEWIKLAADGIVLEMRMITGSGELIRPWTGLSLRTLVDKEPKMFDDFEIRVKPAPRVPREWWDVMQEYAGELYTRRFLSVAEAYAYCKRAPTGAHEIVHVVEVL